MRSRSSPDLASATTAAARASSQRSLAVSSTPVGPPSRSEYVGTKSFDVPVVDEEAGRVPQSEETASDLMGAGVAELEVTVRRMGAEHPSHDVGAHALERLLRPDEVAPGAVHLPTVLRQHLLVAEHRAER